MNLFFKKCQEYQMMCNYLEIFEYLQEFEEKTPIKRKIFMILNNFLYSKKMENHLLFYDFLINFI